MTDNNIMDNWVPMADVVDDAFSYLSSEDYSEESTPREREILQYIVKSLNLKDALEFNTHGRSKESFNYHVWHYWKPNSINREYNIQLLHSIGQIDDTLFTFTATDYNGDYEGDWVTKVDWKIYAGDDVRISKQHMVDKLGEPELVDFPYDWVEKLYKMTLSEK